MAGLCARLIGTVTITEPDGSERRLRAGDIALLAPTHTDLWRYERAFRDNGSLSHLSVVRVIGTRGWVN